MSVAMSHPADWDWARPTIGGSTRSMHRPRPRPCSRAPRGASPSSPTPIRSRLRRPRPPVRWDRPTRSAGWGWIPTRTSTRSKSPPCGSAARPAHSPPGSSMTSTAPSSSTRCGSGTPTRPWRRCWGTASSRPRSRSPQTGPPGQRSPMSPSSPRRPARSTMCTTPPWIWAAQWPST